MMLLLSVVVRFNWKVKDSLMFVYGFVVGRTRSQLPSTVNPEVARMMAMTMIRTNLCLTMIIF